MPSTNNLCPAPEVQPHSYSFVFFDKHNIYKAMIRIIFLGIFLFISTSVTLPAQSMRIWSSSDQDGRAFLGVTTDEISGRKATLLGLENKYGAYVTSVVPGSAAEGAGLQPLDYIVAFNDEETTWSKDLTDLLGQYESGDEVTVHFFRKGKKQSKTLRLGNRNDRTPESRVADKDPYLGITEHRAHSDYDPGVRVNVIGNTTADQMGLKDGDVIMAINGYMMIDWNDITGALNMLQAGDEITVDWERVGKVYSGTGTLKSETNHNPGNAVRYRGNDYAFLGITSTGISLDKAEKLGFDNPYGSYVNTIMGNSAAEVAGLQPFDYVYGIDEYRTGSDQSLTGILKKYDIGETATLHFVRKGELRKQEVTFTDRAIADRNPRLRCTNPFLGVQQSHQAKPDMGVQVNIIAGSTAEEVGLRDGDVITRINGYPILDWADLGTAVDAMNVSDPITVEYERDGRLNKGSAPLQSECDQRDSYPISGDRNIHIRGNGTVINLFGEPQEEDEEAVDLNKMEINLKDMPREERLEIADRYSLEIPENDDLTVNNLRLFPNPSMGMFRLEFTLPQKGDTDILIYNTSGRQIYQYEVGGFTGTFSDDVDIAQNGPGAYFLIIRQNDRATAQKVILTKN